MKKGRERLNYEEMGFEFWILDLVFWEIVVKMAGGWSHSSWRAVSLDAVTIRAS